MKVLSRLMHVEGDEPFHYILDLEVAIKLGLCSNPVIPYVDAAKSEPKEEV